MGMVAAVLVILFCKVIIVIIFYNCEPFRNFHVNVDLIFCKHISGHVLHK